MERIAWREQSKYGNEEAKEEEETENKAYIGSLGRY